MDYLFGHGMILLIIAYSPTKFDRLLMKPYRILNGVKIDIRWAGGWLTPEGEYLPVDYRNGITHDSIAVEYGSQIWGSGSITTRPPIMRIFDIAKWMRITYLEGSSFCVELKGTFIDSCSGYSKNIRQTKFLKFVNDYKDGFESYFINNTEYKIYRDFVAAIRNNDVNNTLEVTEFDNRDIIITNTNMYEINCSKCVNIIKAKIKNMP